ncbi:hypothetical protein GQ457_07G025950 [Hibiscus cannabinus]
MIVNQHILLFIPIFLLPSIVTAQSPKYCNRSCGDKSVPFPFGFSADCQIPLNCSSNDQQLLAGFPILTINADRIKLSIEATCDRPLQALRRLYGPSFAPSSLNAILLQNCSLPPKPCMIPTTTVYTHFEAIGCSPNNRSISCYSENKTNGFVDYDKVTGTNCKSFLSSISAESFDESGVLEIQVIELGWWLQGRCPDYCSDNAFCDEIVPPFNGQPGFRCRCKNGFIGDGYRASHGCRKNCNTARYISGKCGGTAGLALLIGGIGVGAILMICAVLVCCCFRKRQSNSEDRHSAKRFLSEASDISIPIYTYKAIEKATDGFSEKQRLGTGAFGTVPPNEVNLASVATDRIGKGRLDEIIDPFLEPHSDSWTLSSIHKVAELAFRCLSYQRDMRPTMMEVAVELEQIRLSRRVPAEEVTCVTSSEVSPCSSSSNISEQPLSMAVNNKEGPENTGLFMLQMTNVGCMNLIEKLKDNSPVSTQDPCLHRAIC